MDELEQDPVRIAMHDPTDRRTSVVADRIGVLAGLLDELVGARDELPRDRVGWIGRVDQRDELRRHRDRIARRHLFELGNGVDRREAGIDQLARLAQRRRQFRIDPVHGSPAGGVQTT